MGLATAGFLARIFRLSLFGHHSKLGSPMVGSVRPCTMGHPPLSGVGPSATTGSWFSDMGILPDQGGSRYPGTAGGRTVGAQAPVDDLGLVDREAVIVGGGEAGRLADRAVDVSDDTARSAHDVVVVVPDASLVPGRAAGRFDAAHESGRGECVQGLVHGLKGNMADAFTHSGGDRLDTEVVTVPDGLEQRDAGGRHPQAGTAQLRGDGRSRGRGHGAKSTAVNTNNSRQRIIQV